ncbi:MAG: branched-chain amino acid ABC transporter permease [Sphaerochaetaceae bacterium]|jgi:branched-chain amino acid transport system permease protein|nr:branched-chain amino acid ABC transporter permease [Sphaerochaetaceae bacterium]
MQSVNKKVLKNSSLVLIVVLLLLAPLYISNYLLYLVGVILIMAIVAQGLNTMIGWGAIFSFGQPGFMAFGAYFGAIISRLFPMLPFPVILILTAVASALIGFVIGFPCLRLRGFFLAMATYGFSSALFVLINFFNNLTGGNEGMYVAPPTFGPMVLSSIESIFIMIVIIGVLTQFFVSNISKSRTGHAWRSIRDGEIAAASLGINIAREKLKLFTFGSCLGGVGGVLYAYLIGYLQADFFSIMGLSFFLILVVGGIGTVWGPLLGSVIMMLIPQVFGGLFNQSMNLVYGAILLIFVLIAPNGLLGMFGSLITNVKSRGKA